MTWNKSPTWKLMSEQIVFEFTKNNKKDWTHEELSSLMFVEYPSQQYAAGMSQAKRFLLREHKILIMSKKGYGYSIASESDKINITFEYYDRKIERQVREQTEVLVSVDRKSIDQDQAKILDHNLARNAFFLTALQTKQLPAGQPNNPDRPKLFSDTKKD